MENGIEFFTATCLNWNFLLQPDKHKQIVLDSLKFLVKNKRIWLYGFVIMSNHIHLLWSKQNNWLDKNITQMFLKFTAQQIKFNLLSTDINILTKYKSTQSDRKYQFWERRSWVTTMYNQKILEQKMDYIHYNPVKAGMCNLPREYYYSSARFYEMNNDEWGILTHYQEHI